MRRGEVGLKADRLEHRRLGEVGELGLPLEVSHVGERLVVFGPDLDRPLERLEPLVVPPEAQQDVSEVVESLGEVGPDFERPAEVARGIVIPADGIEKISHAKMRLGAVGIQFQTLAEPDERLFAIVPVKGQLAQVAARLGE